MPPPFCTSLTPLDPVSFVAGIIGISVVVTAAAAVPARRAARVDPALTLREGVSRVLSTQAT